MKSHNFTGWHDLTCHCLQAGCRLALDSTWKSLDGESGEWGTNGWGVLTDAFDPQAVPHQHQENHVAMQICYILLHTPQMTIFFIFGQWYTPQMTISFKGMNDINDKNPSILRDGSQNCQTNPGWDLSSRLCLAGIRQSQRVGLGKEFRPRPKNGGIVWKTNMEMVGKSHGKSHRCSHRSIETWWRNVINGGCSLHYHLVI